MDNLAPTRMNLLTRRAHIKLAKDGVGLLKGKREALLKELMSRTRELRKLRSELHQRGRTAQAAIAMARAVEGTPRVRSTGHAGRREIPVQVHFERIWGVEISEASAADVVRAPSQRGLGRLDTSAHILESAEAAERMLELLIRCAPVERNLRMLGNEIRRTSRRINALEELLVPQLTHETRVIARVLEEREREDRFRLKRIKRKKAKQKECRNNVAR